MGIPDLSAESLTKHGRDSARQLSEQEAVEKLKVEVRQQEERIKQLREQISTLEHEQAAAEGQEVAAATIAAQKKAGTAEDDEEDAQEEVQTAAPSGPGLMDLTKGMIAA